MQKKKIEVDQISVKQIKELDEKIISLTKELGILSIKKIELNNLIEFKYKDLKLLQSSLEGSVASAALKCGIDPNDPSKGEWTIDISQDTIYFRRK